MMKFSFLHNFLFLFWPSLFLSALPRQSKYKLQNFTGKNDRGIETRIKPQTPVHCQLLFSMAGILEERRKLYLFKLSIFIMTQLNRNQVMKRTFHWSITLLIKFMLQFPHKSTMRSPHSHSSTSKVQGKISQQCGHLLLFL